MSTSLQVVIPSVQEVQVLKDLGTTLVKSGFLPNTVKTPEQAIAIMLKGKELGIPPMQSFGSIAIVQGKPTISAELMLALIYRNFPSASVHFVRSDEKECTIAAKRPNGKESIFTFTLEDAKRAQLLGKSSWTQYPAAMLRARCISAMARAVFPDALMGASYTPEELGADVNDEGDIIDVNPEATNQKDSGAQVVAETPKKSAQTDSFPAKENSSVQTHSSPVTGPQSPTEPKQMTLEHAKAIKALAETVKKRAWKNEDVGQFIRQKMGKKSSKELSIEELGFLTGIILSRAPSEALAEKIAFQDPGSFANYEHDVP